MAKGNDMGYRIGSQCFDTVEAATDYQMSLVVPAMTAEGTLVHPVKQGGKWTFGGQPVQLSFGDCDPKADFAAGAEIAGYLIAAMALAWGIRFLSRFIDAWGRDNVKDSD